MVQLIIRDFQVIERADVALGGLVLVAGKNSQGKSTIAKAGAAATTGRVQVGGIAKKDGKQLVRDGRDTGSATIKSDAGTARAVWPKCEFSTDGTPLAISPMAAGLEHVVDLPAKERAATLAKLLRTDPDRQDLEQACADAGIAKEIAAKLWGDIEALGWDRKFTDVKEKGASLKGRWEQITGERYGADKAKGWLPKGWDDDLANASLDDLNAEVGEHRQELERAIAGQAVDLAEVERLTAACADMEALEKASMDAQVAFSQAEAAHTAARRHRNDLPPVGKDAGLRCPCCNEALELRTTLGANPTLIRAEAISEDEQNQRRHAIASADGKLSKAKGDMDAARRAMDEATRAVEQARKAGRELAELRAKAGSGTGNADEVQAARDALALAERRHAALKAKEDAEQVQNLLAVNLKVQEILAPDGIRQAKLIKVLDTVNGGPLADLCVTAGWAPVRIEPDLTITYGGRPYAALAGLGPQLSSDQFRVRATLQVALAQLQGDALVIIDAADVLDQAGRNGLIKMLRGAGMDALVCMTFSKPDLVPNLERAGMGRSYWVEDGVAVPLGEVLTAKQEAA